MRLEGQSGFHAWNVRGMEATVGCKKEDVTFRVVLESARTHQHLPPVMKRLLAEVPSDIAVQTLNIIKAHCHRNIRSKADVWQCSLKHHW